MSQYDGLDPALIREQITAMRKLLPRYGLDPTDAERFVETMHAHNTNGGYRFTPHSYLKWIAPIYKYYGDPITKEHHAL